MYKNTYFKRKGENMASMQITTTITAELKHEIAKKGYKISDLIRAGFLAKENNPQLLERLAATDKELKILEQNINRLQRRLTEEYQKREELEQKVNLINKVVN